MSGNQQMQFNALNEITKLAAIKAKKVSDSLQKVSA